MMSGTSPASYTTTKCSLMHPANVYNPEKGQYGAKQFIRKSVRHKRRAYGGKRRVFSPLQNEERDVEERNKYGNEFHTVGAA